MKRNIKFFLTAFLTLLLLTACNTAEEPKQASEPANEEVNTDEKIETTEQPVHEPKENEEQLEPAQNEETKQPEETTKTVETTSITYSTNGNEVTEETTTIDSEHYSIQAIPGFTLTSEEPGKDMLFLEENDEVSMRIETMSINETTYDDIVTNTEETMSAIGEYEPFAIDQYVANHSDISKAAAYTVAFETEKVIMVVFEKEDMIVRLTIYDNTTVDLTDAMVKMGLTIQAK